MAPIPRKEQEPDPIALEVWSVLEQKRTAQGPRRYLGMSQIGAACDRALWYQFRQFSARPVEGRVQAIFELGDAIEALLKDYLTLAGFQVGDEQLQFADFGGLFRGHCDGVITGVTRRAHILECKSANDRKFKAFREAGLRATWPEYYCQCQCYMGYSGLERALLVVYCKNTSDIATERVYFSPADFQVLRARAAAIIGAPEPPERPFDEASFHCQWCDFATPCRRPEAHLQQWRTCGTCQWLRVASTTLGDGQPPRFSCGHQGHPWEIPTDQWGVAVCDDWTLFQEIPF